MRFRIPFFAILCTLFLTDCAVTIPETDRTPPTFTFEITNGIPGGPLRISSSDDLSNKQLNLRRNTLYRYRFTGSDQGGVSGMKLKVNWPTDFHEVGLARDEYIIVSDDTFFRELLWQGQRSDPRSAKIITGQLNTIMYNQSYAVVSVEWELGTTDFGGRSGTPNTTTKRFNVAIVDDTQEVGWVDLP